MSVRVTVTCDACGKESKFASSNVTRVKLGDVEADLCKECLDKAVAAIQEAISND